MKPPNPKIDAELVHACVHLGMVLPFTLDQAKARFRELAKVYHPDVGVARNSERFATISHAYDIIESHYDRLAGLTLTLAPEGAAALSKSADLLHQLHEARALNIKTEKKLNDRNEELATIKKYIGGHRQGGLKRVGAILLFCTAALFLGFLAGMMWTAQSPIVPLQTPLVIKLNTDETQTTTTQLMVASAWGQNVLADVAYQPDGIYELEITSGTITVGADRAELKTSPTLKIIRHPTLQMLIKHVPQVIPTPIPAPTGTPALIPATMQQPISPTTTATAQGRTSGSAEVAMPKR